jgi:hypothetical protein
MPAALYSHSIYLIVEDVEEWIVCTLLSINIFVSQ